jgi:hypothetical protein
MESLYGAGEVAPIEAVERSACDLDILLRHRPQTIPQN